MYTKKNPFFMYNSILTFVTTLFHGFGLIMNLVVFYGEFGNDRKDVLILLHVTFFFFSLSKSKRSLSLQP